MANRLVVKVTAGLDAPERCSQAFTVATTALSAGVDVSLWLTGESAWFALPGRAAEFELPHAAPTVRSARGAVGWWSGDVVHSMRGSARDRARRRATRRPHRRCSDLRRGGAHRRRAGARLLTAGTAGRSSGSRHSQVADRHGVSGAVGAADDLQRELLRRGHGNAHRLQVARSASGSSCCSTVVLSSKRQRTVVSRRFSPYRSVPSVGSVLA